MESRFWRAHDSAWKVTYGRYRATGCGTSKLVKLMVRLAKLLMISQTLRKRGRKRGLCARCNKIKRVADPKVTLHCNLHVGMTVERHLFESREVSGHDLLCGSKHNDTGALD